MSPSFAYREKKYGREVNSTWPTCITEKYLKLQKRVTQVTDLEVTDLEVTHLEVSPPPLSNLFGALI